LFRQKVGKFSILDVATCLIHRSSRKKLRCSSFSSQTDDSSPFKTDSGTPFAPNQEHKSSWTPLNPIEISFDLAIDTILDVSDDIINLTIEDACSGVGLSPIIRKDDSPIRFEAQFQDAISKAEDALVRLEEQEDYTTLIRGMERAPTTSHSPARRLEFFDENESMKRILLLLFSIPPSYENKLAAQDDRSRMLASLV